MVLPTELDLVSSMITSRSSNKDVREFIANFLRYIDASITYVRSLKMAERFVGDEYDALELDGEEWEEMFGTIHGELVYKRFVRFRNEFVDASFEYPIHDFLKTSCGK